MSREAGIIFRPRPEHFLTTYGEQRKIVQQKSETRALSDFLLLAEHEPVYTTGRGVAQQQVREPAAERVPWFETNRGGEATFHGPGQLVMYPIFDLLRHGKDVHKFLRDIERVLILSLRQFQIDAYARSGFTGVWVTIDGKARKIAALGIGVRQWISYHGAALNVSTDLRFFRAISACGLDGKTATSIEEASGRKFELTAIAPAVIRSFAEVFDLRPVENTRGRASEETAGFALHRRPPWLRAKSPEPAAFEETKNVVKKHRLTTVCEEARCPNTGECWSNHTATFMIMGDLCTRRCSFCSVKDGTLQTLAPLDPFEPLRVGQAVAQLGLRHAVVTCVDRDDLPDMGAEHFHRTAKAIAHAAPDCTIEFLVPDLRGKRSLLEIILQSGRINVLNHNIETVPALYKAVRPGASFERSLNVLRWAKEIMPAVRTKSGLMVGLGERREEVLAALSRLAEVETDILTIGQYLRPSEKQLPVARFVPPEEFKEYEEYAYSIGFHAVEAGPLVRSSYHAWKHAKRAVGASRSARL